MRPQDQTDRPEPDWSAEPDLARLRLAHAALHTDRSSAAEELGELADLGSMMAMRYLAEAYRLGRLADPGGELAERWYRRAADAGSARAAYDLALLYRDRGDFEAALGVLVPSAARGYLPAINLLGKMNFIGLGTPRDPERARALWEIAIRHRYWLARRNLGLAMLGGTYGMANRLRGAGGLVMAITEAISEAITEAR